MKKLALLLAAAVASVNVYAQNGFRTPADTVYLRYGDAVVPVHVKSIEPSKAGEMSAYRIKTHEALDLTALNTWSQVPGGYQWTAEQFAEGFKSLDVLKVVFADGFVLPFENGGLDRSLLLSAPSYKGAHGDFLAEGVAQLTRDELRQLIGEETYLLRYRVRKTQARAGLAKLLVGAPSAFVCYLTRANAVNTTKIPSLVHGKEEFIGSADYKFNPLWQTATPAAAVTAVYGAAEMAMANLSIKRLAGTFRSSQAPSAVSFRTKALLGGGLILSGAAVAYLGYDRIAKDAGWGETYVIETTAGRDLPVKVGETGKRMSAPWLLPAAGALLLNFGVTEFTNGLTGLAGYKTLREAGLDRAELHVFPAPYGVGVSMVF